MAETRLEKYKNYRESLKEIKSSSKTEEGIIERESKIVTDSLNTTSTLPIEDVLGKIGEDSEQESERLLSRKTLIICLLAGLGVLIAAGIVIFAVIAFKGGN